MMFPSNRVRVLVSTQPVDFRKGHDGLAAIVSSVLRKDLFTGTVFVFRSRRADRLNLLYWDGTGLVMTYKRLEETTFTWPAIFYPPDPAALHWSRPSVIVCRLSDARSLPNPAWAKS